MIKIINFIMHGTFYSENDRKPKEIKLVKEIDLDKEDYLALVIAATKIVLPFIIFLGVITILVFILL